MFPVASEPNVSRLWVTESLAPTSLPPRSSVQGERQPLGAYLSTLPSQICAHQVILEDVISTSCCVQTIRYPISCPTRRVTGALGHFFATLKPGGLCLTSVRDYAASERGGVQVKPYGIRSEKGTRWILFQLWDWRGSIYDLQFYFVADNGQSPCVTHFPLVLLRHLDRTPYPAHGQCRLRAGAAN